MDIKFTSFKADNNITTLSKHFDQDIRDNGGEKSIEWENEKGTANFRGINFHNNGITLFISRFNFNEVVKYNYQSNEKQPIRILLCNNGNISYALKKEEFKASMNQMEEAIIAAPKKDQHFILFKKNSENQILILDISREKFFNRCEKEINNLPDNLKSIFLDFENENHFSYIENYNLAIAEIIQMIINSEHKGLVRRFFLESKTIELFSLVVHHYQQEVKRTQQKVILRKEDVEIIIRAKNYLQQNIKNTPTIKKLARKMGINENKIKKGFKEVYNKTVNQVLTDARLEQSSLLLADQKGNIKEISIEVGYKNPSHFSRLFKKKFGVLPKDFVKTLKTELDMN